MLVLEFPGAAGQRAWELAGGKVRPHTPPNGARQEAKQCRDQAEEESEVWANSSQQDKPRPSRSWIQAGNRKSPG